MNKTNQINISLAANATSVSNECSASNKLLYSVRLRASVPYGDIFEKASGGVYRIYFDKDFDGVQDGSFDITLAQDLPGFNSTVRDVNGLDDENAVEDALQRLLDNLNFVVTESNAGPSGSATNPIELELRDITIDSRSLVGVPFTWGPAEVRMEMGI